MANNILKSNWVMKLKVSWRKIKGEKSEREIVAEVLDKSRRTIQTPFSWGWEMWIISLTRPGKSFPVRGGHGSNPLRICHMAPWASEVELSPKSAEFSSQGSVWESRCCFCACREIRTSASSFLRSSASPHQSSTFLVHCDHSASSYTLVFLPLSHVDGLSLTLMWAQTERMQGSRGLTVAAIWGSQIAALMWPFTYSLSVYREGIYVYKVRVFIRIWNSPLRPITKETLTSGTVRYVLN